MSKHYLHILSSKLGQKWQDYDFITCFKINFRLRKMDYMQDFFSSKKKQNDYKKPILVDCQVKKIWRKDYYSLATEQGLLSKDDWCRQQNDFAYWKREEIID